MTKNEILRLVEKVKHLKKGRENTLPCNSFFLDRDEILCYPRNIGDSRYPYYNDGLVLFAHSDGYMDCVEGDFNVFKCANYNEDTNIAFFAGEPRGDDFVPISITGAAHQLFEEAIDRYTVFTPVCAYYIVETASAIFALRVYVDDNKHLRFSVGAINRGKSRNIYLCSYFEPTLRNSQHESFFARLTKYGEQTTSGSYILKTTNAGINCLAIRKTIDGNPVTVDQTTAKNDLICHKGGNLTNALGLRKGALQGNHTKTNTTEIPVACDIVRFLLEEDSFVQINYEMLITQDESFAKSFADATPDFGTEDFALTNKLAHERQILAKTDISFKNWKSNRIHPNVLNNFLGCVRRQVSLCALGKNYATSYLGIRDVFQQLELSLIWQQEESRAQMVRVMDFILGDGRPPRQITFPTAEGQIPKMDLRPFIDQGFWIISAFHNYLSYTDDYSILNEICGYYKAEATNGPVSRSTVKDSILEHLLKIMSFLISNIDESTGCIRALFGDWNDALDGLGQTKDATKEFGNGVSVMATLQLYLSLVQMCEILEKIGGYDATVEQYTALQSSVADGVKTYALVTDHNGFARMAHGWGEDRTYYVGSFYDYDGASRISLTANAFCAISGIIEKFPLYKDDIVKNILALDSRFGLLTFDKPFTPYAKEVGRISTITPGTYENACTYVHAGTFGTLALFKLGHAKEAWDILEKAMVISHDNVTLSTFVMPNSYCIDGEFEYNGESMGDWYTGSGAVLIKNIIKCGFGIEPMINDVKVGPSTYFPSDEAEISLPICGNMVNIRYENKQNGTRHIYLNGQECDIQTDPISNTKYALIPKAQFKTAREILIVD